jgi:molybdopterin/thiamine biosynthesis adenylyltransferase
MIKNNRQLFFIDQSEQEKIKKLKILIAGVGLGSIVAECLIRLGCENLTIIDGDDVEITNLNRQNYRYAQQGLNKASCLKRNLNEIYEGLNVNSYDFYLDATNIEKIIEEHDVVINTIDFDSGCFNICNQICKKFNVIEIFPMNLGFGSSVIVSHQKSESYSKYFKTDDLKDKILEFVISQRKDINNFLNYLSKYKEIKDLEEYKDPQLGIASFLNAAIITTIIVKIVKKQELRYFPELYHVDLEFDI